MNLTVIKEWFSLLSRGEVETEMVYLSPEWIEGFLTSLSYTKEAIYTVRAIYIPTLQLLQVTAEVPPVSYASFSHLGAEQYVRVISQAQGLLTTQVINSCPALMEILAANPEAAYYRGMSLRFRRLVRSKNDPFVVTIGLTNIREVKGIWQLTTALTDGPFVGELDAVFIPSESTATADEGLSRACYTIWQEIVSKLKSAALCFATRRISRHLKEVAFLYRNPPILPHQKTLTESGFFDIKEVDPTLDSKILARAFPLGNLGN